MSTRKNRKSSHGKKSRYHHKHGNRWQQGFSSAIREYNKAQYICEVCGNIIPGASDMPPLCPRCMIPMQLMKKSNINIRKQINRNKKAFDYSSRIYYQTDGHPQYVGLPLDHPDPEDEEAVARYLERKQNKQANRRNQGHNDSHRKNRRSSHRKRQHSSSQGDARNQQPAVKAQEKEKSKPAEPDTGKSQPVKQESRAASKNSRKRKMTITEKIKQKPKTTVTSRKQDIKPDDYEGTALTRDASPTSLLNKALSGEEASPPETPSTQLSMGDIISDT